MTFQNFNTNIADPINYSCNSLSSTDISPINKIDFHKVEDYKGEYTEASTFAKILILFFLLGLISFFIYTVIVINSF